ncbi:MAG: GYD domain-containing protein [Dehalococcoidia bacterium]
MPMYCTLGKATPIGAADLRGTAERFEQNQRALEAFGAKIVAGYACLGQYDFLFIIDAPDNETAMRLSALTASRGTSQYETIPLVPIDEFFKLVSDIGGPPDTR